MKSEKVDQIDVEELMNEFRIQDVESFTIYLKELWKDLSGRSENKEKGVNVITFSKYYQLPGIILDRLFNVLDKNKDQHLDVHEFVDGFLTLFTEPYEKLVKFVFNFYDFDKDGYISKEDIRTVLSYVTLNTQSKFGGMKFERENYKDRVESQDELQKLLDTAFKKDDKIDLKTFCDTIENVNSEVFLYIIIFLLEKRPFNKKTLNAYASVKKSGVSKSPEIGKRMIASPSLTSKFSPSISLRKSPAMNKRSLGGGGDLLEKLHGKKKDDPKANLLKYVGGDSNSNPISGIKGDGTEGGKSNPVRKMRDNLRNLEKPKQAKPEHSDVTDLKGARKYEGEGYVNIKTEGGGNKENLDDSDEEEEEVKNEGFLYKITNTKKLKKLWFKQIDKDLYCKYLTRDKYLTRLIFRL